MAKHYQTSVEEIKKMIEQQGGEASIENSLRTREAVEALAKKAKVTDGEWIDENQAKAVEAEKTAKKEKPAKATKKKPKKTSKKKDEG